jgi:restriction system protein
MVNYWGVRLGEGGKFVKACYNSKIIAIGWFDLDNLEWLNSEKNPEKALELLKKKFRENHKDNSSESSISLKCGEIFRFVREFKEGDIVLVPEPQERKIIIGKITGPYRYVETPKDGCDYKHRRAVEWLKELPRDELSQKLKNSLVWLTVVSLEDHSLEIDALIQGQKAKLPEKEVTGEGLYKAIIERLKEMEPRNFEKFIAHLLDILGFDSATPMNYVGDKGIDVIGKLDSGLTNITVHVQVKKVSGSLGIGEVLNIRGTLGTGEHGAIITTSRFTNQAEEEAQRPEKIPITLIDGERLVELVLEHYEEFDEEYKDLLNIDKKEIPMKDRFIIKPRK